jgi:hypothetical protein
MKGSSMNIGKDFKNAVRSFGLPLLLITPFYGALAYDVEVERPLPGTFEIDAIETIPVWTGFLSDSEGKLVTTANQTFIGMSENIGSLEVGDCIEVTGARQIWQAQIADLTFSDGEIEITDYNILDSCDLG